MGQTPVIEGVAACQEAAAACLAGGACRGERRRAASGDTLEVEHHTAQEELAYLHSQKVHTL